MEAFLFPHKTIDGPGYGVIDFDQIYQELVKPVVNLTLLYLEHEELCRTQGSVPYSYRSFLRHYKNYVEDPDSESPAIEGKEGPTITSPIKKLKKNQSVNHLQK